MKRSLSPGFAGIPNPLFAADNCLMLFEDGKKAIVDVVAAMKTRRRGRNPISIRVGGHSSLATASRTRFSYPAPRPLTRVRSRGEGYETNNEYFLMRHSHAFCLPILVAIAVSNVQAKDTSVKTVPAPALEQYVAKPDASYSWKKRREGKLGTGTFVELTLTSQTWRDIPWKHQLFIYRPSNLAANAQAMLLIAGGSWNDSLAEPPCPGNDKMPGEATAVATLAELMRAPVAVLMQVPEQPLFGDKKEDEIISYTFVEYMKSGDAEWPLLLPMVKSAVRAMDAVQEFAKAEWQLDVQNFLVTGASKRGWTTWLTAAVDPRVNALAPMVINMLNMRQHMDLQKESFGGYSEQIADYTEKGLQNQQDTPRR